MSEQTLYYQRPPHSSVEKDYVLCDDAGMFITFDTAQEADDWIRSHTPGVVTHYQIDKRPLTEGENLELRERRIAAYHNFAGECPDITMGM